MSVECEAFRSYFGALSRQLQLATQDTFEGFTADLHEADVISLQEKASFDRKFSVSSVLTHISLYVNGSQEEMEERLVCVLDIMETSGIRGLGDITKKIREMHDPVIPKIPNLSYKGPNYRVFLSFKWGEGDQLKDYLYACLKEKGLDPWKDTKQIRVGDYMKEKIEDGVDSSMLLVAMMSPGYFKSDWCKGEFIVAMEKKIKICPIQWKFKNFQYPEEVTKKDPNIQRNMLRHRFNPKPVRMEAELARCAEAIMNTVNSYM